MNQNTVIFCLEYDRFLFLDYSSVNYFGAFPKDVQISSTTVYDERRDYLFVETDLIERIKLIREGLSFG